MKAENVTRIEELKNNIAKIDAELETSRKMFFTSINNIVAHYIEGWEVYSLLDQHLEIQKTGNNWMRLDIKFHPEYKDCFSDCPDTKYLLETNTACFGSFSLIEENDVKDYFNTVGILVSNTQFISELKDVLAKYYRANKISRIERNNYKKEIDRIEYEEHMAEKERLEAELFEKQKEILSTTKDGYVVIQKESFFCDKAAKNFIYRAKEVRWSDTTVYAYADYYDAERLAKKYNNSGIGRYAVVEVSKLKIK